VVVITAAFAVVENVQYHAADELWEEPWLRCGDIFENKMKTERWE